MRVRIKVERRTILPLLGECSDRDINDVYQKDIARMERVVMSKAGLIPFLAEESSDVVPGFFIFEVYTERRWVIRRRQ